MPTAAVVGNVRFSTPPAMTEATKRRRKGVLSMPDLYACSVARVSWYAASTPSKLMSTACNVLQNMVSCGIISLKKYRLATNMKLV